MVVDTILAIIRIAATTISIATMVMNCIINRMAILIIATIIVPTLVLSIDNAIINIINILF